MAGGAVVSIKGAFGHLGFLYVWHGIQSRGVVRHIWFAVEQACPEVEVWEIFTPWFEKWNIYCCVSVCGFVAIEYFRARHPDPHASDVSGGNDEDVMFRFVKRLG